jgi:hypothetical protein
VLYAVNKEVLEEFGAMSDLKGFQIERGFEEVERAETSSIALTFKSNMPVSEYPDLFNHEAFLVRSDCKIDPWYYFQADLGRPMVLRAVEVRTPDLRNTEPFKAIAIFGSNNGVTFNELSYKQMTSDSASENETTIQTHPQVVRYIRVAFNALTWIKPERITAEVGGESMEYQR